MMPELLPCPNCGAVVWENDNESLTEKRAIEL